MASIQKELASGIIYTAISKYSGIIISLAVAGVLARLIDPEEFGVVAIATVIISFFSIFSDLGIAPAIIQNKHLTEDKLLYAINLNSLSLNNSAFGTMLAEAKNKLKDNK